MKRRGLRPAGLGIALVAMLVVLPACGGGSSKSAPPCPTASETRAATNGEITVCAYDIRFDVKTITTAAGPLKVTFVNKGSIAHTFKVENTDFELKAAGHNDSQVGTVSLNKGSYKFECTISGHAAAGMRGTIEVS
jgi:plastocyanin